MELKSLVAQSASLDNELSRGWTSMALGSRTWRSESSSSSTGSGSQNAEPYARVHSIGTNVPVKPGTRESVHCT